MDPRSRRPIVLPDDDVQSRARARIVHTNGGRTRARTIAISHWADGRAVTPIGDYADVEAQRPQTRGDCKDALRPCPFVSCSHHLFLDVSEASGALKLNFPHLEVWEMGETCSLDIADRGGATLDEVGNAVNITRERARQIEERGLTKIRRHSPDLSPGSR